MKSVFPEVCLTLLFFTGCGTGQPKVVEEYVHCRSLEGDRTAVQVFAWEFDAVSDALRTHCAVGEDLTIQEIEARVSAKMAPELRGSLDKPLESIRRTLLELQVRGVFAQSPDKDAAGSRLRRMQ